MKVVEICCGSYEDCLAAYHGGAKRVELNSVLHLGGLTPSVASLVKSKQDTTLKIITMVRPRAAGFNYSKEDIEVMFMDAKILLENGADGIAFGFLNLDGTIDIENTKKMVDLVKSYDEKEAVFHRAYDCVKDPYVAIEQLIELGVNRILTSGLKEKAIQGKALIKELISKYGNRIEILAGSGINDTNVIEFIEETNIQQVHSSCKDWKIDPTTTMNGVSYAYHNENDYEVVSLDKVKKIIELIKE